MKDKHIVAVFNAGLMNSLSAAGVLDGILPFVGHGALDSSAPGVIVDQEAEHQRLVKMLDSACLLTVGVTGLHAEEARAIHAAEEKSVPCGIILRTENRFVWETLPHLCSKYAFVCCIGAGNSMGPPFPRLLPYPCEIEYASSLITRSAPFAQTIRICLNHAQRYGRDVPPIHERSMPDIRPPYAGNMGD